MKKLSLLLLSFSVSVVVLGVAYFLHDHAGKEEQRQINALRTKVGELSGYVETLEQELVTLQEAVDETPLD